MTRKDNIIFAAIATLMLFPAHGIAQDKVLAQIDLSKAKIGWIYHQDSPISDEMDKTVFSQWCNPLIGKKWSKAANWTIQNDHGEKALHYVAGGDGIILTKENELTDYRVGAKIRFLARYAELTPGNGKSPKLAYRTYFRIPGHASLLFSLR